MPYDAVEVRSFRQLQCVSDESIDFLSHGAALEGASGPTAMDLEFENQMEVAQLKHPAAALGEKVHAPKVVDDKRPNPCLRMRRNSGNDLFPPRRALLAGKEQGIEEESRMARA